MAEKVEQSSPTPTPSATTPSTAVDDVEKRSAPPTPVKTDFLDQRIKPMDLNVEVKSGANDIKSLKSKRIEQKLTRIIELFSEILCFLILQKYNLMVGSHFLAIVCIKLPMVWLPEQVEHHFILINLLTQLFVMLFICILFNKSIFGLIESRPIDSSGRIFSRNSSRTWRFCRSAGSRLQTLYNSHSKHNRVIILVGRFLHRFSYFIR